MIIFLLFSLLLLTRPGESGLGLDLIQRDSASSPFYDGSLSSFQCIQNAIQRSLLFAAPSPLNPASTTNSSLKDYMMTITVNNSLSALTWFTVDTAGFPAGAPCGPCYPYGTSSSTGLVSLGNASNSLLSSLNMTTFAYCLQSLDSQANSQIYFGDVGNILLPLISTPLYTAIPPGQENSYYCINLDSIGIGKETISLPRSGAGGNLIIEPSTFLTYLPPDTVDAIIECFETFNLYPRAYDVEEETGLLLCFDVLLSGDYFEVPPIVWNFDGVLLTLPIKGTFVEVQQGVQCLTIVKTSGYAIWGSALQAYLNIEYDLKKNLCNIQLNDNCLSSPY
ncbi:hypothetical protein M569_11447 [Genlisea aurea]|uniref:Peptidase A1 domain-containing protein n=1 Tax=Genlisea aurea TaxID=192259 RepID=S8DKI3_9LAMI|nr:hypothetical protein M569_11447 [Genlisea aurea]